MRTRSRAKRSRANWDDRQLVAAAVGGDVDAADVLFSRYDSYTRRVAARCTSSADAAADAAAMGRAAAFEKLSTLRDPDRFGPWVATIVRNCAFDARRRVSHEVVSDHLPELPHVDEMPGEASGDEDRLRRARAAVLALPARDRKALELSVFERLPVAEVAAALTIDTGAAYQVLSRARKRARRVFLTPTLAADAPAACRDCASKTPEYIRGSQTVRAEVDSHVETCLSCRTNLAEMLAEGGRIKGIFGIGLGPVGLAAAVRGLARGPAGPPAALARKLAAHATQRLTLTLLGGSVAATACVVTTVAILHPPPVALRTASAGPQSATPDLRSARHGAGGGAPRSAAPDAASTSTSTPPALTAESAGSNPGPSGTTTTTVAARRAPHPSIAPARRGLTVPAPSVTTPSRSTTPVPTTASPPTTIATPATTTAPTTTTTTPSTTTPPPPQGTLLTGNDTPDDTYRHANAVWDGAPLYGPGPTPGTASFRFDGADGLTDPSLPQLGSSNFTVSFELDTAQPMSSTQAVDLVGYRSICMGGDFFDVRLGGSTSKLAPAGHILVEFSPSAAAAVRLVSTSAVDDGAWTDVSITRVGGALRLDVDGVAQATATLAPGTDVSNTASWQVADRDPCTGRDGTMPLVGLLADLYVGPPVGSTQLAVTPAPAFPPGKRP